jgi:hypothetical protein
MIFSQTNMGNYNPAIKGCALSGQLNNQVFLSARIGPGRVSLPAVADNPVLQIRNQRRDVNRPAESMDRLAATPTEYE